MKIHLYHNKKIYPRKAYKLFVKIRTNDGNNWAGCTKADGSYIEPYNSYVSPTQEFKDSTGIWVGTHWDLLGFKKQDLQWVVRTLYTMCEIEQYKKQAEEEFFNLFCDIIEANKINFKFEITNPNIFDFLMGICSDLNLDDILFYLTMSTDINYYENRINVEVKLKTLNITYCYWIVSEPTYQLIKNNI